MDKFLAWLSEAESVLETLEGDVESRRAAHQLKELQADIERQAQTHSALRNSSLALLGSLAPEDALMLQLRGDEMERRWQVCNVQTEKLYYCYCLKNQLNTVQSRCRGVRFKNKFRRLRLYDQERWTCAIAWSTTPNTGMHCYFRCAS